MDNIEFDIHQLCSGYKFIDDYIFDTPTIQTIVEADNIRRDFLYKNRFESMLRAENTEFLLIKYGLLSVFDITTLNELPKKLDSAKLLLFQNFLMPSQRKRAKTQIQRLKDQYDDLIEKKLAFHQYTLEHLADRLQQKYIISKVLLNKNYKSVNIDGLDLESLVTEFKKNNISISKFREIARSDVWSSIWNSTGLSSFRVVGPEQRNLISYAKFYENIYKHPEKPSNDIIDDDDALDGWLLHIRSEQDRKAKEQDFDKTRRGGQASEQFIVAKSWEDAQVVNSMNDTRAKIIRAKTDAMRKRDGVANEFDVPEVRQDAIIQKR